nr:hypothetical protein [Tanacetum cinerariifolium]
KQQSLYHGKVLLEKHDPSAVHDSEETLQLAQETKFVGDFKSLAKEANESLANHKALELEIMLLLRAVFSQDIMSVVQNNSNDWYKKCEECKFDKISYDKALNDMQQKMKGLQAQLGDLKGKSKDTSCVSDTHNPLSQKLENENIELEFQVFNYAKENAHLKTTYKNLFDSISVSDQKDNTRGTSANTKFAKQSFVGNLHKVDETHGLSKPVTSNSTPTLQGSNVVKNDTVIAPGMFRINPFKPCREEKNFPNKVRASVRTKPITVSQPPYLFHQAEGRNSGSWLSEGYFIGYLTAHFGLVSDQRLRGLLVVVSELPVIHLHELGRLNICARFIDTWAWVASRLKRQHATAAGAPGAAKDALAVDEGAQAVIAPVQAP